jgi:hypothetical protein
LQAGRLRGLVLLPQQHQRHTLAAQLLVELAEVGQRHGPGTGGRRWVQRLLKSGLVPAVRQWPGHARLAGAAQAVLHGGAGDTGALGDVAFGKTGVLEPENLADLAHG